MVININNFKVWRPRLNTKVMTSQCFALDFAYYGDVSMDMFKILTILKFGDLNLITRL